MVNLLLHSSSVENHSGNGCCFFTHCPAESYSISRFQAVVSLRSENMIHFLTEIQNAVTVESQSQKTEPID